VTGPGIFSRLLSLTGCAMPYWFPAAELFVSFLPVLSRPEGGKNAL
jgi:hypothetical protein